MLERSIHQNLKGVKQLLGKLVALAGALIMVLLTALSPPAKADTTDTVNAFTDWGGTAALTGSLIYTPSLPGYLKTCAPNLPVELKLDSPAFALKTPTGVDVVPLTIRGTGTSGCASEALAGVYNLTLTITAGGLLCENIGGGYIHSFGWIQGVFGSAKGCTYKGAPAQSWGWVFEGAYTTGHLAGILAYGV